ncbi:amino acid ABC transporter permease [Arthrobacter sp. FW305-123]|nr:amino acid ABC transporter permease [Arthrobacter sp. FW305-123]
MTWVSDLLAAVPTTILIWSASVAVGAVLAIAIAAGRTSSNAALRTIATVYIEVFRGIPTLVWLFIVFFGLTSFGFSPTAVFSAILTLGIVSSAYIAEIYRSGLNAVPTTQREATTALGLPAHIALMKVVVPQAKPIIFAGLGSFGIHLLKETALASLIGVVELMNVANYLVERGANGLTVFLIVGLIYIALCLPIGGLASLLGRPARAKKMAIRQEPVVSR